MICGGTAYEAFLLQDGGFGVNVPEGAAPEAVVYQSGGERKLLTVQ